MLLSNVTEETRFVRIVHVAAWDRAHKTAIDDDNLELFYNCGTDSSLGYKVGILFDERTFGSICRPAVGQLECFRGGNCLTSVIIALFPF